MGLGAHLNGGSLGQRRQPDRGRGTDFREKALYHQIHPLKLLTDWASAFVAAYLLWQHHLLQAVLVGLLPPVAIAVLLIRYANLESYKVSPVGRYVRRYMTRAMEAVRLIGGALVWAGAWSHVWALAATGLALVVGAWLRGKLWPGSVSNPAAGHH